jgi:hypothetical protein
MMNCRCTLVPITGQRIVFAGTPFANRIRVFCDDEEVGRFGSCALIPVLAGRTLPGWIDLHMQKNGIAIGWMEDGEPQWLMYRRFGKIRWEYA